MDDSQVSQYIGIDSRLLRLDECDRIEPSRQIGGLGDEFGVDVAGCQEPFFPCGCACSQDPGYLVESCVIDSVYGLVVYFAQLAE